MCAEAGYYVHYKGAELVEKVIELSTSYGCPFKCKYCASSSINEPVTVLKPSFLFDMLSDICEKNSITAQDEFVLTMTGIGDYSNTFLETNAFLCRVKDHYPKCKVILSSCAWTDTLISHAAELLSEGITIKYLQWTYISTNIDKVHDVINNLPDEYDIQSSNIIREAIDKNKALQHVFKYNYLMIKGVNDSDEDFDLFVAFVKEIKSNIVVRISKLNDTQSSKDNYLEPPTIGRLEILRKKCEENHIEAYIFWSEKNDNMNCGQLIYQKGFSKRRRKR